MPYTRREGMPYSARTCGGGGPGGGPGGFLPGGKRGILGTVAKPGPADGLLQLVRHRDERLDQYPIIFAVIVDN